MLVCRCKWLFWSVPWSAMVRGVHFSESVVARAPVSSDRAAVERVSLVWSGYEGTRQDKGTSECTKYSIRW